MEMKFNFEKKNSLRPASARSRAYFPRAWSGLAAVFLFVLLFSDGRSFARVGKCPFRVRKAHYAKEQAAATPAPAPAPGLIVAGAGDIILHGRVHFSAAQRSRGEENNQGYDELFPGVAAALSGVDLGIANLEFPILRKHKPPRPFIFSGDPPALRAAMRAGLTAFTAANNHSYDQGPRSPAITARHCAQQQAVCMGVGEDREQAETPYFFEKNGIKLAVVGYTLVANEDLNRERKGAPAVNGYGFENLLGQVKAAAEKSDCVVVAVHWGEEYREQPLPSQRQQAQKLVDAGACLILGHHPHVLEPVEEIRTASGRRALIAYSLGNFVSNQERGRPEHQNRIGAIVKVELARGAAGVEPAAWKALPVWTRNQTDYLGSRSIERLEVVDLPAALREVEARRATAPGDERTRLEREAAFYQDRIEQAERMLEVKSEK